MYPFTQKKLGTLFLYITTLLFLTAALIRYRIYLYNDFNVYWASAKSVSQGSSAYVLLMPDAPYVNGPLLSILFAPFSNINSQVAFCAWFILSVVFLYLSSYMICKRFFIGHSAPQISSVFSLLAISYPVRHSLALGQIVPLALFLIVVMFIYNEATWKNWVSWVASFSLVFAFELKPYLVIFAILFLVVKRKYLFLLQSFIIILCLNALYFVSFNHSSWMDWYKAIRERSNGLTGDPTQSSLLGLLHNNTSMNDKAEILIFAFSIIVLFYVTMRTWSRLSTSFQFLTIMSLGPIISPYSHEQDFIFSAIVAIVVLLKVNLVLEDRFLITAILCLMLNISSTEFIKSVFVVTCFLVILYFSSISVTVSQLLFIAISVFVLQIIPQFLDASLTSGQQLQLPKIICLILGYLCWCAPIYFARKPNKPLA